MAWSIIKSGTVAVVNAAVNALVETGQSTAQNAQLVRAKAIILAEITAVGGSNVAINCNGAMLSDGGSSLSIDVQNVPFVDSGGNYPTELGPNPLP